MDLYSKKNNIPSERTQRVKDRYDETTNNKPRRYRNFQKIDNNLDSQVNYRNNPRENEDIPGNNNPKKNIKYVINIGKNKDNELRDSQPSKSSNVDQK